MISFGMIFLHCYLGIEKHVLVWASRVDCGLTQVHSINLRAVIDNFFKNIRFGSWVAAYLGSYYKNHYSFVENIFLSCVYLVHSTIKPMNYVHHQTKVHPKTLSLFSFSNDDDNKSEIEQMTNKAATIPTNKTMMMLSFKPSTKRKR